MAGPVGRYLDGDVLGRLHLQHGPIDLVIGVDPPDPAQLRCARDMARIAHDAAIERFSTVLDELVGELPLLKSRAQIGGPRAQGNVARRMQDAVLPFCEAMFITPMAAVAGAVADEVLAALMAPFTERSRPLRAYVNNGGDIALHLDPGSEYRSRMKREDGVDLGDFRVDASSPSRGIATSGRGGRSLSMGIADSVTVLAVSAAAADAAATVVANAVDLPGHSSVMRVPANALVDDSDLGDRLVVSCCDLLDEHEVELALRRGAATAERLIAGGFVHRAGLFLQGLGILALPSGATSSANFSPVLLPAGGMGAASASGTGSGSGSGPSFTSISATSEEERPPHA